MSTFIEKYKGLKIYRDEDGFSAQNGPDYAADNADSLEEARDQIDDYWCQTEFGPLNGFF